MKVFAGIIAILLMVPATGRGESTSSLQLPNYPLPEPGQIESKFSYEFGRKLTVGILAGMNSEVLFMNMPPKKYFSELTPLIYSSSFVVMDELVQRYNLDSWSMFFMGSIFGLFLEGIVLAQIPTDPVFFLPFITTFWHGAITTLSSFELTELYFPRRRPGAYASHWVKYGGYVAGTFGVGMGLANAPTIVSTLPIYWVSAGLGLWYYTVILDRIAKDKGYQPNPWVGLGLIGVGYVLGNMIGPILEEDWKKDPDDNEGFKPYDRDQRNWRSGIYLSLSLSALWEIYDGKKNAAQSARFPIQILPLPPTQASSFQ